MKQFFKSRRLKKGMLIVALSSVFVLFQNFTSLDLKNQPIKTLQTRAAFLQRQINAAPVGSFERRYHTGDKVAVINAIAEKMEITNCLDLQRFEPTLLTGSFYLYRPVTRAGEKPLPYLARCTVKGMRLVTTEVISAVTPGQMYLGRLRIESATVHAKIVSGDFSPAGVRTLRDHKILVVNLIAAFSNSSSCQMLRAYDSTLGSGYYILFINGKATPVYCNLKDGAAITMVIPPPVKKQATPKYHFR